MTMASKATKCSPCESYQQADERTTKRSRMRLLVCFTNQRLHRLGVTLHGHHDGPFLDSILTGSYHVPSERTLTGSPNNVTCASGMVLPKIIISASTAKAKSRLLPGIRVPDPA